MTPDHGLEDALARARTLVDERFGVVRQVVVHEVGPSDPPVFCATAELASTHAFSDAIASRLNGGAGLDRATAMIGALGEAVERYAIAIYREAELVRGSLRDLAPTALDPRTLIFFADEQYGWPAFPYVRFDPAAPLSWVRGTSLFDGAERLVPAPRVFTPYRPPRTAERLMQSTSTGAACHVDWARAVLAALYECVERDAVMIAWLNRLALPRLDHALLGDRRAHRLLGWLADAGFTVDLLDATTDLALPTVLSVLRGPGGTVPSLAVGAATRARVAPAAEKALIESAHTLFWIHTRCRDGRPPVFRDDYADVTSLDMHSLLYGAPRMRGRLTFLADEVPAAARSFKARVHAATDASPDESIAAELERCVATLHARHLDVIAIDVTPADVAALGFVVARVVVTELHPLWGGHHLRCLGGRRVRSVPVELGYYDTPRRVDELNTDPHPMP